MNILNETYKLQNEIKIPKLGFGTWQTPNDVVTKAVEDAINDGYRLMIPLRFMKTKQVSGRIKNSKIDRSKLFDD